MSDIADVATMRHLNDQLRRSLCRLPRRSTDRDSPDVMAIWKGADCTKTASCPEHQKMDKYLVRCKPARGPDGCLETTRQWFRLKQICSQRTLTNENSLPPRCFSDHLRSDATNSPRV